jgi:hypothetical protein
MSTNTQENGFIPDTLLIDNKQNAIFIETDATGEFQITNP